ncbi:hypothetical protein QYF36_004537 [Acer negundo]|nr:hypothetical protein QYF36_004537 [Acer negundo]
MNEYLSSSTILDSTTSCSVKIDYKKNENKKVAVNDFLPSATASEAIQYSMDLYAEYIMHSLRR